MASKTAGRGRQKGTGTYFKKGNRFYFQTKTDGIRKTELLRNEDGTPCTTESQAKTAADKIIEYRRELDKLQDHETAVLEISKTRKLIAGLTTSPADIWPTFEQSGTRKPDGVMTEARKAEMERVCRLFVDWCSQNEVHTLADITEDAISAFLNAVTEGKSGRTYNAYRTVVKYIFKHTWKQLKLDFNPAENIEGRAVITEGHKELTEDQANAVFDRLETGDFYYTNEKGKIVAYKPKDLDQIRVAMLFAMFAGARAKDACCMRWSNIDLMATPFPKLTYKPSKTRNTSGKEVTLFIATPLLKAIFEAEKWREQNRPNEDYITPSLALRYIPNPSTIGKVVEKLIECATGLKPTAELSEGRARAAASYGFHSFKHSFVTFAARAGIPQAVVAEIVGWGSPAMIRAYAHADDASKRKAVETIPVLTAYTDEETAAREQLKRLADKLPIEAVKAILDQHKEAQP